MSDAEADGEELRLQRLDYSENEDRIGRRREKLSCKPYHTREFAPELSKTSKNVRRNVGGVLCREQARPTLFRWRTKQHEDRGESSNVKRRESRREHERGRQGRRKRDRERERERNRADRSWGGRQRNGGVHGRATHARSIKRAFTIDQRSIEVDHELKTVVTRGARRPRELFARLCKYLAAERRRPGGGPNDRGPRSGAVPYTCAPAQLQNRRDAEDVHRARTWHVRSTYQRVPARRNTRAPAPDFSSTIDGMRPRSSTLRIAPIFKDYRTRRPCEPSLQSRTPSEA